MSLDEKTTNIGQMLSGLTKEQLVAESQKSLMKINTLTMILQEETRKLSVYQEMIAVQDKFALQKITSTSEVPPPTSTSN